MTVLPLESTLACAIVVGQALFGLWIFPRVKRALARGEQHARVRGYAGGIASDWLPVLVVVAVWLGRDHAWSDLGLTAPDGDLGWASTVGIVLLAALFVVQTMRTTQSPEALDRVAEQYADLEPLMPHTDHEQQVWILFSITAGLCEELLYRGFAFALLVEPVGVWGALGISSVAFGLIHAYQGAAGVVRTGVMGLVFGGMYALSGSLWGPIVFHVLGDIVT
ncbi:MAG: CPBP family intramembrane metalloprotease, partial [Deltaproteobacteria bacterium]|nr:CPBP family intramembrane metalloprotease [Deltaproteobacteria bacterium]